MSWVIPASTLHVGLASARTGTTGIELPVPPVGTPAGQPLTIAEALAEVLHVDEQPTAPSSLGLRLMGVDAVDTPLHVAVLRAIVSDHGPQLWEDATVGWTFELDSTNIPAALWGKAVSDTVAKQPSAESINSLTGLQHLKPPAAHTNGQPLVIDSTALGWDDLTHKSVPMDTQAQPGPIWHAGQEDILALLPTKAVKRHGIAQALVLAGFEEAAHFAIAVDAFRPLYAEPLSPAL